MSDKKPAKQPAPKEEREWCLAEMGAPDARLYRCGRPIYKAPEGVDTEPLCLMHSRDPQKDDAAFQAEFERILQAAGGGTADFTGFVFPSSNYGGRAFKARCDFKESTFNHRADFSDATFTQHVDFWGATFTQDADFHGATFTQRAYFHLATFIQGASFWGVMFAQDADFRQATFTQEAQFIDAVFAWDASFFKATFSQDASFCAATFSQRVNFSEAVFKGTVEFDKVRFRGEVEFREVVFRRDESREPGLIFSLARVEKPEAITFYKTYLGQALFHNCDVSRFVFSDVDWLKRANSKCMVFEESVGVERPAHAFAPLDQTYYAKALRPRKQDADERNYGLIAELYQQLKKNYDDRRDYWTAGDFHYGEMEMKRLHSPSRNWLARRLHRHLGLMAWYNYASEYGESYVPPFIWLVGVLLAFALLAYPLVGLRYDPGKGASGASSVATLTYMHACLASRGEPAAPCLTRWKLAGRSIMTALYVAAFQKDLVYEPSYPWGRLLALLEVLLTSTLIALFLLAVRRQFRR